MGADLSRVRFDASQDLSGVVMQQGRGYSMPTGTNWLPSWSGDCAPAQSTWAAPA